MRPQGNPKDFAVDQRVRYKPGTGTYGYEDYLDADGRIPAVVIGHSPTRVRIRLTPMTTERANTAQGFRVFDPTKTVCVDAASLRPEQVS